MNSHDLTLILVAVIANVPVLLGLWLKSRRDKQRSNALHNEVRTNHGKRLGEHVEDIDIKQDALASLLVQHTMLDDARFTEIKQMLTAQNVVEEEHYRGDELS